MQYILAFGTHSRDVPNFGLWIVNVWTKGLISFFTQKSYCGHVRFNSALINMFWWWLKLRGCRMYVRQKLLATSLRHVTITFGSHKISLSRHVIFPMDWYLDTSYFEINTWGRDRRITAVGVLCQSRLTRYRKPTPCVHKPPSAMGFTIRFTYTYMNMPV